MSRGGKDSERKGQLAKVKTASTLNHQVSTASMLAIKSEGSTGKKVSSVVKVSNTPAVGSKT
jgi:hypothetical protein